MAQLTKHFKSEEFACKCGCGFDNISLELVAVLENIRDTYMYPVKINSGCRCCDHNKAVGGEEKSKHMQGIAADIVVEGYSPAKIYQYLDQKYKGKYGIGEYPGWVHIDVRRGSAARWRKL
jgi:uncharacterized protein YcbK (DUF882 family)